MFFANLIYFYLKNRCNDSYQQNLKLKLRADKQILNLFLRDNLKSQTRFNYIIKFNFNKMCSILSLFLVNKYYWLSVRNYLLQ